MAVAEARYVPFTAVVWKSVASVWAPRAMKVAVYFTKKVSKTRTKSARCFLRQDQLFGT